MRKSAEWWTSSRKPPGRASNRTATPGQAVQHRETGGGVHVHVLAARCDLETGKSLNIAAPGWQKTFDALRDWQNHENGWSRPDDPERARDVQPGHRAYIEAAQPGWGWRKTPERLITDYLSQGIEPGAVSDRATMISALRRAGLEVPRQREHYLTAADPESGGKWRLKGAIYERDFQRERLAISTPHALTNNELVERRFVRRSKLGRGLGTPVTWTTGTVESDSPRFPKRSPSGANKEPSSARRNRGLGR